MSEFNPIVYFVSVIGAEILKDVTKHLAKKGYEIAETLREPIIELKINDYENLAEVGQKLEANPDISARIEKQIAENQTQFAQLLEHFKANPALTANKFYNINNEKVINIETNYGTINM